LIKNLQQLKGYTATRFAILDNLPSLCQKLSDLVGVWRSYNKNNFACFLRHGVLVIQSIQINVNLKANQIYYRSRSYAQRDIGTVRLSVCHTPVLCQNGTICRNSITRSL